MARTLGTEGPTSPPANGTALTCRFGPVSLIGALLALGAMAACSGKDSGGSRISVSRGDKPDSGAGPAEGMFFGGDAAITSRYGNCVAEVRAAEGIPLDLYTMFDQSGSMLTPSGDGTRLDVVRAAITDFMNSPDSSGMGVGIGYFGYLPLGQTSCDPTRYETPAVTIRTLPEGMAAVVDSLNGIKPVGETPTAAAIRGACSYASEWKTQHPEKVTVILLITDGVPEAPITSKQPGGCAPTLDDAVAATTECRDGTPGVSTYVLGVGPSLSNLEQIAKAGGTEHAYLVEGGDVGAQVLAALNAIRGAAQIPCELKIPPPPDGQTLDFDRVNISFVDGAGGRHQLYRVNGVGECGGDEAWYYDDPSAPKTVKLCEQSCARVKGDVKGRLEFALGCSTVELTR